MKAKITLLPIIFSVFFGFNAVNAQNPTMVKDINSGIGNSSPSMLLDINGTLFFTAYNTTNGTELWKSDGTEAGTLMVEDIVSGSGNSNIKNLTNVNGTLFFTADDGVNGEELWKSNGTEAGTVLVKDIFPGNLSSSSNNLTNVNGTLFFVASIGSGPKIWKSDGTDAGTVQISSFPNSPVKLMAVNNMLVFVATDSNGKELWKTDGTEAGTALVKDLNPGSNDAFDLSLLPSMYSFNGMLYFCAQYSNNQWALWKTDGTDAGTVKLKNGISTMPGFIAATDVAYFATVPSVAYDLWKTDGTEAGTVEIKQNCLPTAQNPEWAILNNKLLFKANDNMLWESDGTLAGTVMIMDINAKFFIVTGNTLYFSAVTTTAGHELWSSDGTEAGTAIISDIYPGTQGGFPFSANPSYFTISNGNLFFTANNGTEGIELWKLGTSTSELSQLSAENRKVSVYPNPSKGVFEIKTSESPILIQVFTTQGKMVLEQTNSVFDLTAMPAGMYLVKVQYRGGIATERIIKE